MHVLFAMGVFVLSHILIARTAIKPMVIARFGERTYLSAYSILSIGLLGWVIVALIDAERIVLWPPPEWAYTSAVCATFVAFLLVGIGSLVPNPLSVALRKNGFNPENPGVIGWIRHPMIWGLTLWGLAHIPANGDFPSIVLFAGSALFGLIGTFTVEKRKKRQLGQEEWRRLTVGRGHIDRASVFAVALGVGLWVFFLILHPYLFGVDPLAVLLG
ncbi:MAG: NnrU family protein [Pseudomonadota bacterium]